MFQTARPAPPPPPDPAELAGLCATLRTLSEAGGRGALGDDGWAEMADRICELAALARQQSFTWTMRTAELAAARAEGFEAGRASVAAGKHRVPGQRALWPVRVVPSFIPLGPVAAKIAAAVTATAAGVTLGAIGAHQLAAPHAQLSHAPGGIAAASLAPVDADPFVVPVPSYAPKHASLDAKSSRPLAVTVTPSWPLSRPAVRPAPSPSRAAPSGTLDVATVQVRTGVSGTGEIDFEAVSGPVTWWAWASDGIALDLSTGTLASGQPQQIAVTAGPGVTGTVWVSDGGQAVAVPVTG